MLLISDGADNGSQDPARIAQHLLDAGIRVHALSVVDAARQRDLRIDAVHAPNQVQSGDLVTVQVEVAAQGYSEIESPVRVVSTTGTAADKIAFFHDDTPRTIEVAFVAGAPGVQRYEAVLPVRDDEVVGTNNRRTFVVDVVPREEVYVLFLEGRPRAEFSHLRRALEADDEIVVDAEVALDDDSEYRIGGVDGAAIEVMSYDAVLLGDVAVGRHLDGGEEALAGFVSQRGGGLLVLGSQALTAAGPPLRDMLPVLLPPEAEVSTAAVRLATLPGSHHAVASLLTAATLARLPPLRGFLPVSQPKPAASVQLQADGSHDILMATHRYGAGRVAFVALIASWHWRAFTDAGDATYDDFWRRAVRSLVTRDSAVRLELERFTYDLGEPVQVAAQVVDADYAGLGDARVAVAVGGLEAPGDGRIIELTPALGQPGRYEATWEPRAEGEYQLDAWAQRGGARLGEARGFVEVRDADLELEGRIADVPLLQRLARQGGGLFFTPDEVGEIPERLPLASPQTSRRIVDDLWDTPWLYLGILGLLAGEWLLRRRRGLIVLALAATLPRPVVAQEPPVLRDGDNLRLAYVEHDTRGGWGRDWQYYGGGNLQRFLRQLGRQTSIRVSETPESVSLQDADRERLFAYPVLFMTSNNPAVLSDAEIANLREYLLRGGFLFADDCVLEGSFGRDEPPAFTRGTIEVFKRVFPERSFVEIPKDHAIYHCVWDFPDGLPQMHEKGRWPGLGLFEGERLMVLLSPNDFCCGLQFNWGQFSRNAYRFGVNAFVYALTH